MDLIEMIRVTGSLPSVAQMNDGTMKDFLKETLIEPFTDRYNDWTDYLFGTFMWLIALSLITGFLWLSGWLIDSSFLPTKQKQGIVTNHYFVPAHTIHGYHHVGKVLVPYTTYVSERYMVTIKIDGLTDDVSLYKSFWNKVNVGDKLCCEYTNGRLLSTLYIQSFCGREK
jgi:hypothetical protein